MSWETFFTFGQETVYGEGNVQEWEPDRSPFSGVTGLHKIVVHVTA